MATSPDMNIGYGAYTSMKVYGITLDESILYYLYQTYPFVTDFN